MKYPLYVFRDLKAGDFSPPMCHVNEATAKRDFDLRLHSDKSMGFAPADYDLYYIGEFDTSTGVFEPVTPDFIVNGAELYSEWS